jgi:porin
VSTWRDPFSCNQRNFADEPERRLHPLIDMARSLSMPDHRIAIGVCAAWLGFAGCAALAQPAFVPAGGPGEPASARPGANPEGAKEENAAPAEAEQQSLTGDWGGVRTRLEESGITLSLQEQSEVWSNVAGGLRRGTVYDGVTTASVNLDLEKALGWTGTSIFANAYQIHGRGPTPNLVGSLQSVSGIEADRTTRLYNLYLEQNLLGDKLSLRIGQEGADTEFMISKYAELFLNGSFGFPTLASLDLPSGGPNYPLAALFMRAKYQVNDNITLLAGVFNGDPAGPGPGDPQLRNASGTAFRLGDGALAIAEFWYDLNKEGNGLSGTYKIGGWYHSGSFADQRIDTAGRSLASPLSTGVGRGHWNDYAGYVVADQMVWRVPAGKDAGIRVFGRVTAAPGDRNLVDVSANGGITSEGMIPGRPGDVIGLGFAYAHISNRAQQFGQDLITFTGVGQPFHSNETVFEATYLFEVTPWWTLQADIQHVINPGAGMPNPFDNLSRTPLKNATQLGLRATVIF